MTPFLSLSKAMKSRLLLTATTILVLSTFISIHHIKLFSSHQSDVNKSSKNDFHHIKVIPIEDAVGPESFAFDRTGNGPYTGVSDGRIIRWQANESRWIDFAVTSNERHRCEGLHAHDRTEHICGRPLGLRFNERTGDLYIADAYKGLIVVGPDGGLATKVPSQAQGIPFGLTNALDIDQSSGVVYFTDSSLRYQRRHYISSIVSGDKTGRVMKYEPMRKQVTVIHSNLSFPNGVALSKNGDFILVAETTNCRILKLWLQTQKAGTIEIFAQLIGFPDNIRRNLEGEFWVGIHSRRGKFLKWILSKSWITSVLVKLPFDITKVYSYLAWFRPSGLAVKLSEDGDVLEMLEDGNGKTWKFISEVEERNGDLWIGSVKMPFVVIQKMTENHSFQT